MVTAGAIQHCILPSARDGNLTVDMMERRAEMRPQCTRMTGGVALEFAAQYSIVPSPYGAGYVTASH